jgi:hypothetical protein
MGLVFGESSLQLFGHFEPGDGHRLDNLILNVQILGHHFVLKVFHLVLLLDVGLKLRDLTISKPQNSLVFPVD